MHKEKLIALTRTILSQPTAPFHEQRVKGEIRAQLASLPHVTLSEDAFGNLIARYSRGGQRPKFAFAAHMDHPGWVREPGTSDGSMRFLGGVKEEYLDKCAIQSFGDFGMWNLHPFDMKDDKIYGRACDDLVGCAAIVAMMHDLEEKEANVCALGLFTRAEEVGFVGAIQLAKSGILPKNITVLSLETSAENALAKIGGGPIIRVGDKTSIFDPDVTRQITWIARRAGIHFQRLLMSGGTCEATAYRSYEIRTGALCVALGNYHNCTAHKQIGREFVSFQDYQGLIELCAAIASDTTPSQDAEKNMRRDLDNNLRKYAAWVPASAIPETKPAARKTRSSKK